MARPRKSEPRYKQLNLSLTAAEYESILQRGRALGMRPVPFSRAVLLAGKAAPTVAERATGNNSRLIYTQVSRLGNNLNQMVRHLHQTGDPLPADLEPLLKDIRQIIARALPR